MKKLLLIPGIICLIFAGYMAIKTVPGYGYFLAIGLALSIEAFDVISENF
jgi:hypothetical protein